MVLRPIGARPTAQAARQDGFVAAWPPIERAQREPAEAYWLIAQPDHAALSGALASNFISPKFPKIDEPMARAIEVHDAGWAAFESEKSATAPPPLDAQGKPLSFLEIAPQDFLRAWVASIERAEQISPAGGYVVSRHFCALGHGRLASALDGEEDAARLRGFLEREAGRRRRLQQQTRVSPAELDDLVLVLQFCDLLSLYLCCGAAEAVEFPQEFSGARVRVRRDGDAYLLDPSPFQAGTQRPVSLGVEARYFPATPNATKTTTLPFLLW